MCEVVEGDEEFGEHDDKGTCDIFSNLSYARMKI